MIAWIFRFSKNSRKTSVKIMGELTYFGRDWQSRYTSIEVYSAGNLWM